MPTPSPRLALTLLSALAWLQPAPVLPLPSRSGPDGPPRPYGVEPVPEVAAPRTSHAIVSAQDRALLRGPFPHGGLERGVSDGALLLDERAPVRALALLRIRAAGAGVVRIPVDWRAIVAPAPAQGFDARDPASPAYGFGRVDAAVRSAVAAGLSPLLVVSHAPDFAEAPHRWPYAYPGSWAPSPAALGAFAQALARRYDGSFPDPAIAGRMLPRVKLLQAWNEPNLPRYLEPQWVAQRGRWSAFSPRLYRQLLDAFYAGVKSVARSDVVVAAGVAPTGDPEGVGRMAPLRFLGEMLCLPAGDVALAASMPWAGHRSSTPSAPKRSTASCPDPPSFDVLAFHPLSVGDPDLPAPSSLDVSIADAGKITGLLRRAERRRSVRPAGIVKPVWVTELNWESAPPAPHGVPRRLQALWVSRALHRLWVSGVALVDWQFLVDPYPSLRLGDPTGSVLELRRPAGLYSPGPGGDPTGAQPKPFLRGFAFPFDALRVDRRHVRVWALLARPKQPVVLQRRLPGRRWRLLARLRADGDGVLNALLPLAGTAGLRLRSGASGQASPAVEVAAGRSPSPARATRTRPSRRHH